jgi:hypothetical protein
MGRAINLDSRALARWGELGLWIVSAVVTAELSDNSHTFTVVPITYVYGCALLARTVFVSWLRFRKRSTPMPLWLRIVSGLVLAETYFLFAIYLLGVATYFG